MDQPAHEEVIGGSVDSMKFDEQDLHSLTAVVNAAGHDHTQHIPIVQQHVDHNAAVTSVQANNLITILGMLRCVLDCGAFHQHCFIT